MDDTFVSQCSEHNDNFLQHINSISRAIKFTVEDMRPDGLMPFCNTLVIPEHNGTFSTRVYKNLHTQFSTYCGTANTILEQKNSVINTLNHRAKTVSSNTEHLK